MCHIYAFPSSHFISIKNSSRLLAIIKFCVYLRTEFKTAIPDFLRTHKDLRHNSRSAIDFAENTSTYGENERLEELTTSVGSGEYPEFSRREVSA